MTDPGWFITAKLGKATIADSYDELNYGATSWEFSPDYNSAISLGYEIESFGLEAEYSHRRFDAERRICPSCGYFDPGIVVNLGGYQIQDSFLITGTWFPIHGNTMKPFLGAGYSLISWKNVRMESNDYGFYGSDSVFTYKLTTGVEFQLMEKMAILLGTLISPFQYQVLSNNEV